MLVQSVMTRSVTTIEPDQSVRLATQLMHDGKPYVTDLQQAGIDVRMPRDVDG